MTWVASIQTLLEKHLSPITDHKTWPAMNLAVTVILGLAAAVNQPTARGVILTLFVVWLFLIVAIYSFRKIYPLDLGEKWLVTCMRHHSSLFERMLIGSAVFNRVSAFGDPAISLYSYPKGSLEEFLRDDQMEHNSRLPNHAGYLVTFDAESGDILRNRGIKLHGREYKLSPLVSLGIDQDRFMRGLVLEETIRSSIDQLLPYARPLYSGLSGVVVKAPAFASPTAEYEDASLGVPAIDLKRLLDDIAGGRGPDCDIVFLNWPTLLMNICAVAAYGRVDIGGDGDKKSADVIVAAIKASVKQPRVKLLDNPFVALQGLREAKEQIVIGGGSWMIDSRISGVRLLPLRRPNGKGVLLRYVEVFGFLMPTDRAVTPSIIRDANKVDLWISRQIRDAVYLEAKKADKEDGLPRIGTAVWGRPSDGRIADPSVEVENRRVPSIYVDGVPDMFSGKGAQ